MLDLKFVRTHPELVRDGLKRRRSDAPLDELLQTDQAWRGKLAEVERLKAERNEASEAIGALKRERKDASEAIERMKSVSARIKELDQEVADLEAKLDELIMEIPNVPHESVPDGAGDEDNVEVKRVGEPRAFGFEPEAHWDLGVDLGVIDFERAGKVTGARFAFLKGAGARLERALIQFMLDLHLERGYTELLPPYIVNAQSMRGTGQLPKFAEDMFHLSGTDYYLVPTAEVPVTNYHAGEILDGRKLPLYYTAYSPCFRAEAGADGRDTRGLIRQHQFEKVELVKIVDARDVLRRTRASLGRCRASAADVGASRTV